MVSQFESLIQYHHYLVHGPVLKATHCARCLSETCIKLSTSWSSAALISNIAYPLRILIIAREVCHGHGIAQPNAQGGTVVFLAEW
jgi:hypothetical protein